MTTTFKMPEPSFFTAEFFLLPECATEREWMRSIEELPFNGEEGRGYQALYTTQALHDVLEQAARKCEEVYEFNGNANHCAIEIRAMIGKD